MNDFKILFVDDEESIRMLALEILRDLGYHAQTEGNAMDAIKLMEREKFDILITDIKMPGINGIELIKKAKLLNPDITTIVITGYGSLETARMAIKEGAYDYILKPFDLTELKTAVNNAIEKKRLERENIRLREITKLFQVSQALRTDIMEEETLKLLLTTAINQTESQRGSILLLEDEGKRLLTISNAGFPHYRDTESYKVDDRIKLWIDGNEKTFIISSQPWLEEFAKEHDLIFIRSDHISIGNCLEKDDIMISVPIRMKQRFYGVINVIKTAGSANFTKGDLAFLGIIANQAATAIDNMMLLKNLHQTYYETVKALALILEAKDPYTYGHSDRVGDLCVFLGLKMGLSSKQIELLKIASSLHDIGKIAISESLLNKPMKLSDDEFNIIKKHPVIADEILKPIKFLENVRPIIRAHHERYDGKGYPDGLDGKILTPELNIIIAADAFDAMNSKRPYRDPLNLFKIKEEFKLNCGTQFDPEVGEIVIKYLENGELLNFIGRTKN